MPTRPAIDDMPAPHLQLAVMPMPTLRIRPPRLCRLLALPAAVALVGASCHDATGPASRSTCDVQFCVLFVGGSLTNDADAPGIFEALARATGKSVRVDGSYLGGATLGDHLAWGSAERMIATRAFNVVALEQGPSSRPENRQLLREWVGQFAPIIRAGGATPALYMTWPTATNRASDARESSRSYRLAANDVNGLLFPIGDAYEYAWARDPWAPLYEGDGWHPSVPAGYLAALVIYGALYRTSVLGLPASVRTAGGLDVVIDPRLAITLQRAADDANANASGLSPRY